MTDQDAAPGGAGFDAAWVDHELARHDPAWPAIRFVRQTGSTNADGLAAVAAGAQPWTIVVADCQVQGRGRLDRRWEAPRGTALLASVILRLPAAAQADAVGWVPLLVGMAVTRAIRELSVRAEVKWPNDVVVCPPDTDPRKLGGILVERHGNFAVAGFGINTEMRPSQLPVPTATSLLIEKATSTSREVLLVAVMIEMRGIWGRWLSAGADVDRSGLREQYLDMSATLGCDVAATLPGGEVIAGRATKIDHDGHLVINTAAGDLVVAAGDVEHLRTAPGGDNSG